MNISSKTHEKKGPTRENFWINLLLKLHFQRKIWSKDGHNLGLVSKIRALFPIFNHPPSPLPPTSCAPVILWWSQSFYCWLWPGKICWRSTFALFLTQFHRFRQEKLSAACPQEKLALLHFRSPFPPPPSCYLWLIYNGAESFTVALTLTLGGTKVQ